MCTLHRSGHGPWRTRRESNPREITGSGALSANRQHVLRVQVEGAGHDTCLRPLDHAVSAHDTLRPRPDSNRREQLLEYVCSSRWGTRWCERRVFSPPIAWFSAARSPSGADTHACGLAESACRPGREPAGEGPRDAADGTCNAPASLRFLQFPALGALAPSGLIEGPAGIEPALTGLQSAALPLGQGPGWCVAAPTIGLRGRIRTSNHRDPNAVLCQVELLPVV